MTEYILDRGEGYNPLTIRKNKTNWQWLRNVTQYGKRIWEDFPDYFTDDYIHSQIQLYAEGVNELRVAIIMAGGGAAGKTTTTHTFAIGEPDERSAMIEVPTVKGIRPMKVNWTILDNCAIDGNWNSGTDNNIGPGAVAAGFKKCLEVRDVAIVDGMVSSPKWALMCNDYDDLEVVLLHFDLTAEDLMDRLAARRGEDKETFRERMFPRCKQLISRAWKLVEHFETKCKRPVHYLKVTVDMSPNDIVVMLDDKLCELFGDCVDEV